MSKDYKTSRAALQDAFSPRDLSRLQQQYKSAQLVTPPAERKEFSLMTNVGIRYYHIDDDCYYIVDRFIGLEALLPPLERAHFLNNRAAHAATHYLLYACSIYNRYQREVRYEREKEIFQNWKTYAHTICKHYCIQREQLSDNLQAAYSVIAMVQPHLLPIPQEILSFSTNHNVSRKRNIIFGIN